MNQIDDNFSIAIVGPCASGKTTLACSLRTIGFSARQIAQEHSYVANMWELLTRPTVLIYLDASLEMCTERKSLLWSRKEYEAQIHRLRHARENCHIFIDTDDLTPEEVLQQTLRLLDELGIEGRS